MSERSDSEADGAAGPHTDFDSLFVIGEADQSVLVAKQQQQVNFVSRHHHGSGYNSPNRGSPARRIQGGGSCKHPHTPGGLSPAGVKHSHSMRDQTSHMKEKYQARYQHRRLSIRTPTASNNNTPKQSGSRANSLTVNDVEITRQFLATNTKVINRGDSFRRKDNRHQASSQAGSAHSVEVRVHNEARIEVSSRTLRDQAKPFRVVFLGGREVGKSSIIHQFMSSEHTDVFEDNLDNEEEPGDKNKESLLTVDVNNVMTQLSLLEIEADYDPSLVVEEYNPDCFVLVYAVDDRESFESIRACLSSLSSSDHLAGKRCILVGAKSDLVRSRLVSPSEGTSAAIQHGVKFTEISAGVGCNIDSLLVGIVLQCRLDLSSTHHPMAKQGSGLLTTLHTVFSKVLGGNQNELKKQCLNLNI